jgi:hypothetical protein
MSHSFSSRGFLSFLFEEKEDRYIMFISGPYFMGAGGIDINCWNLNLNPENVISLVVPISVRIPFLPLYFFTKETLREIGNSLG